MVYRVQLSQEVAKFFGGRRRRTVATAVGPTSISFGDASVYLPWLPVEVAADEHLLVKEVSEDEMRLLGGSLLVLPAPPPSAQEQQATQQDLSQLNPAEHPGDQQTEPELSLLEASPAQNPAGLPTEQPSQRTRKPARRSRR